MKLLLLPNDHQFVPSYKPYSRVVCRSVICSILIHKTADHKYSFCDSYVVLFCSGWVATLLLRRVVKLSFALHLVEMTVFG